MTERTSTWLLAAALTSLLTSCSDSTVPQTGTALSDAVNRPAAVIDPVIREPVPGLTREYAEFRRDQVSNVRYSLSIKLEPQATAFSGEVVVDFELDNASTSPLTLDFDNGVIESVALNGKAVPFDYERWFLSLAPEQLVNGANTMTIRYRHPYANDGAGLYHFTDPEDGLEYLYTNFEPFDANRWFPHFDQPDIKAPLTLDVLAPSEWQIIANTREASIEQRGAFRHWQFPPTAPLSSYVYALHAGPYHQWESAAGNIPLRLFSRQSMAQYVSVEDWFEPTRNSFRFFQDYFDVPYPFGKYDQVIVPDFNAGAMENVGAVTFREGFLSRGTTSLAQRRSLAYVIAHEMAHMWFGNLVTMKWWNGLWLNESFATYMGFLALESSSEFTQMWDTFYSGSKIAAYAEDSMVTTHPIELDVPSTSDAFTNFDGITYEKGASVLKQLPYFIGEDNFRRGASNYLKTHSFGNTGLEDFVGALAQASGMDLAQWQQEWLYQSGTNTISPEFSCTDGSISALALLQAPSSVDTADKVLRSQRTQLGLYRYSDNQMLRNNALPVSYSGMRTEVPEAIGLPCPDLLLPNEDDWAFMKINLDPVSRTTLSEHINDFASPTTRLMLWQSLWDSVLDGMMSLNEFTGFALQNLGAEKEDNVLRHVSGLLASAFSYYARFGDQDTVLAQLESFAIDRLQAAPAGSESQKIWYSAFVRSAHTPEALLLVRNLLDGTREIEGIMIDQDKRWDLVKILNRYRFEDYAARLEAERVRDPSDQGNNLYIASEVIRPDPAGKARWLSLVIDAPDTYKLATLRYIMGNLFPPEQGALLEQLKEQILQAVPDMNSQAPLELLGNFTSYMDAATCTPASAERLSQANAAFAGMQASVVKAYLVHHQNDARCVLLKSAL